MADVKVITGDLHTSYEILDTVFAVDSHTGGIFSGADPNKAFCNVKQDLIKACKKLGGNAVINCQFEYRVAHEKGLVGNKQVVEIFAYGTAVK